MHDYLLRLDRDVEEMFNLLVGQMAEREGVTDVKDPQKFSTQN